MHARTSTLFSLRNRGPYISTQVGVKKKKENLNQLLIPPRIVLVEAKTEHGHPKTLTLYSNKTKVEEKKEKKKTLEAFRRSIELTFNYKP